VVGIIWPPPLWIASACSVTSCILKRTPLKFSSERTPCSNKKSESLLNVNNSCVRFKAEIFYLFRGPLKSSYHRVLNFIEVLYTLGAIDQYVRSAAVRSKAPDFSRLRHVVIVFLVQITSAHFEVISRINFALKHIKRLKFTFGRKTSNWCDLITNYYASNCNFGHHISHSIKDTVILNF